MKKLALVAISVIAFTAGHANASPIDDVSSTIVSAVASELNQVTSSIQSQVQQSITESVETFFNEKIETAESASSAAESEE